MTDAAKAGRKEWLGLAVLVLPCLIVSMDMSVLNFALPFLSADLRPSSAQMLWIMDIYGFLLAGMLLTMGTLGDRFGRRRLLLVGAAAFGIASVVAAYSTSAEMLIATRALLGVAGATLGPSTLSLIRNMFHDPGQRRTAIAVWTAGFSGGAMLGPLVGGTMLEHFWWGSAFLVNVPFMALLLVLGPVLLPEFRTRSGGRLDLASVVLSLAAVLTVIYGVKRIAEDGLGVVPVLSVLAGALLGLVFLRRQRSLPDPMLDVRLFENRPFSTSIVASTLTMFAMVGFLLFSTQYLQLVLGMRPFEAALWNLPVVAVMPVGALLAVALLRRIRPAYVMGGGLVLVSVGFAVMTQIRVDSPLAVLLLGFAVMVLGISAVLALASDMVVSAAPPARAGSASALSEASSELGAAVGIAVLGSVGAAVYRAEVAAVTASGVPREAVEAARETLPGAVAVASRLPEQVGAALLGSAQEAFTRGMALSAIVGAVLMAVTAVAVTMLLRRMTTESVSPQGDGAVGTVERVG